MIVVVTGGRDYADAGAVDDALDTLHADDRIVYLCHGGARGADRLADEWARRNGVHLHRFDADWSGMGRRAGPYRNGVMLRDAKAWSEQRGQRLVVIAFPGGRGTADCVRQATDLGLDVRRVS